jgi:hypothetical protein
MKDLASRTLDSNSVSYSYESIWDSKKIYGYYSHFPFNSLTRALTHSLAHLLTHSLDVYVILVMKDMIVHKKFVQSAMIP